MAEYVAFLRGINVGGHRISGPELCSHFADLGLTDVRSFRASGNVIFDGGEESAKALGARVEQRLEQALGYAVPTFVRGAEEVRAIAEHEPFDPAAVEASKGKCQVALLAAPPGKAKGERVLEAATGNDRLALLGKELYWLPVAGTQTSDLSMETITALIGPNTMRTKGTVEQIAAKFFVDRAPTP